MKTEKRIGEIQSAPKWMVDNRFLLGGYRIGFNTFNDTLKSLFIKHNDLMNVWTHLIGAIIFIGILVFLANWKPINPQVFKEINQSLHLFVFSSVNWRNTYKNQIQPHLNQLYSKDLYKIMKRSNIGFLQMQQEKLESLFTNEREQIDLKLSEVLTEEENLSTEQLKKQFAEVSRFSKKYYLFLLNNVDKFSSNNSNKTNKNLSEYIRVEAKKLIEKFEKLKKLEKENIRIFSKTGYSLERYPIAIFLCTAIFCLLSSTIFHLFHPISLRIYTILHKIDLAGISILNFGSSFAMYYYYFYCMTVPLTIYCTFIFLFCFGVFFISLGNAIHLEENVHWKSLMYAGLGLINLVPLIHICVLSFYASPENDYIPINLSFFLILLMAGLYLGGLGIYSSRFPERLFPNRFDIWFNSHTIWHIFVFLAAFTHFMNLLYMHETRHGLPCF